MLRIAALVLALLTLAAPVAAQTLEELMTRLPDGGFDQRAEVVAAIGATGDERAAPVLETLGDGDLYLDETTGRIVRGDRDGRVYLIFDPITGEALGELSRRDADKINVNNALRRAIRSALGSLRLSHPDPERRLVAATGLLRSADPENIEALDTALAAETDDGVRLELAAARAASVLASDMDEAEKVAAVEALADRGGQLAMSVVAGVARDAQGPVAEAAQVAMERIERTQAMWGLAQDVVYGLSLGSVLMLAAIGLAISFGVMGVINMAHGELVMIGAYTTYVVQEVIRTSAPGLFEVSLLIAAPLAFLVSGAVGVGIERGVVRWLYGRPLETLLATWGVSLILQQAVRSLFGPTNKEVGNPDWMSGALEIGQLSITWNRLWIMVFALAVFALLLLILKKTPMGLQMRAVTQNRSMAAAMGVRTGWVDAMTFGLGAGVAGLAGVALSQIDNVSPNLGQSYIVDSFMVVVFGGVGNLWGALAGAFTLGVVNKLLEPWAGAVLGKVLVLVFIILFIQRRPRGLFALRGRAVEQ